MSAAGPGRPGWHRDCPPWCEADHDVRGPVHQAHIATINRGSKTQVVITIQSDPRPAGPFVAVDVRNLTDTMGGLFLSPDEALDLAKVMAAVGRGDVAAHLRHAAELLSDAPDDGGAR